MVKINAVFTRNTTKPMRSWNNRDFFNAIYDSVEGKTGLHNKVRIAHNTYVYMQDSQHAAVRLHNTDVVVYYYDRKSQLWFCDLHTGGHNTVTTKSRINQFTPADVWVYQRNFQWYVEYGDNPVLVLPHSGIEYVDYMPHIW